MFISDTITTSGFKVYFPFPDCTGHRLSFHSSYTCIYMRYYIFGGLHIRFFHENGHKNRCAVTNMDFINVIL